MNRKASVNFISSHVQIEYLTKKTSLNISSCGILLSLADCFVLCVFQTVFVVVVAVILLV